MKAPFWATRDFRLLLFILITAGAALVVLVFEILPAMSRKLPKAGAPASTDGFLPRQGEPRLPEDEKLKAVLDAAKDSTPVAQIDGAYAALIEYLNNLNPETLASAAKPLAYSFFFRTPQTIRGRAVSVTAMFLDWKPIALEPKIGAVEFVNRVYLVDPSGTEGYIADLLEPPPAELAQKTLVTIDGLFLKTGTYEGNKGLVEAPVVLGRKMHVVKHEYQPSPFDLKGVMAGIAILSVGLLFLTVWAYRQARQKRQVPPPRPNLPPGSFPRAWPQPSERTVKPAFAVPKEPRPKHTPHRHHVSEEIFSVSGGQRRALLFGIGACGVVLAGMLGWLLYQRFGGSNTIVIDFSTASASLLSEAESARKDILEVEQRVWTGQKPLETQDYELIRTKLPLLEKVAEKLRGLIQGARGRDVVSADSEVGRVESRLFEVQLWIHDANGVLDFARDPASSPGFTIPLHQALDKWHAAQSELASLDAEKAKAAPDKAIALKATLESVRSSLAKLAEDVRQRTDRTDLAVLRVPDLDKLLDESKRIDEAISRVEKLLAPSQN